MIARFSHFLSPILGSLSFLGLAGGLVPSMAAEEIKVEAKLVWGTNESTSKNPKHKPLDEETAKKLQKIFKWQNYFLETRLVETVAHRQTTQLKMSKDCTVEITELAGAPVQVQLLGKGKLVNKTTKSFNPGEWIVIGGDDSNECAWFVILSRL
jgi:hypothetical protein